MKKSDLPLISIIIPTKNSSKVLKRCLESIQKQNYKKVETIVVDNYSTDNTVKIAKKYTSKVFLRGWERSPQRNYGVKKSKGDYILFLDSDMELSKDVLVECIKEVSKDSSIKALKIPEESFGKGFWAQCKKLERSFYVGIDFMEAARFFERDTFLRVGGYNEDLISGEDWYLSQLIEKQGRTGHVDSFIYHNEGTISLLRTIQKKYYYARFFSKYVDLEDNRHLKNQISIFKRYKLFFSQPKKLFRNPMLGIAMLFMKTCEFGAGGFGYLLTRKGLLK